MKGFKQHILNERGIEVSNAEVLFSLCKLKGLIERGDLLFSDSNEEPDSNIKEEED